LEEKQLQKMIERLKQMDTEFFFETLKTASFSVQLLHWMRNAFSTTTLKENNRQNPMSAKRIMSYVSWNIKGLIYLELLNPGQRLQRT